jgi:hypothetical protein
MATFGFAQTKRFRSRREHFEYVVDFYSVESLAVVGAAFVAMLMVVALADPFNPMLVVEVELLLLIASVPTALLCYPVIACVFHASGQSLYIINRVNGEYGFSFDYYTHHSLLATLALTVVVGVLTFFCFGLYSFGRRRLYSEPVEMVNAAAMTSLLSVQFFLTLATLGMSAGYTGAGYTSGAFGWRSSGYSFTVQHCISFFFSAALYATRYEHDALSLLARRLAWAVLPPILGFTWLICISTSSESHGRDPYSAFVDVPSFVIGVSASVTAWLGVGALLHV